MVLFGLSEDDSDAFSDKNFKQIVAISGDGNLKDDSDCSRELREYSTKVEAEKIYEHAEYCLNSPFENSGLALQDLVNELGRRLGFSVINGLYKGTRNVVGHDGLWQLGEQELIIEVKTTDAYRLSLQTLADYKLRLFEEGQLSSNASVLIVVGREDTGGLEEQIRGSRHAWDIRVISVRALCNLVTLNIKSDEIETANKIRAVLKPIEYTRVDGLIDVMLATVNDVDTVDEVPDDELLDDVNSSLEVSDDVRIQAHTPTEIQAESRRAAIKALSKKLDLPFVQARRTDFQSTDKTVLAICLFSKIYGERKSGGLWFGINPIQFEKLTEFSKGFFLFCSAGGISLAIPLNKIEEVRERMNVTNNENSFHWHVQIDFENGRYLLALQNGERVDVSEYILPME